jgi:hypothetical protein
LARIRVYVQQSLRTDPETVVDASGSTIVIPFLRVFTLLRIGRRTPQIFDGIIDTGAPLSVFPRLSWKHFASEVEWLMIPPERLSSSWLANLRGRTGGRSRCRIGRVFAQVFDLEKGRHCLPSVPILAHFEEVVTDEDRIILGLHAGILEGRHLILEPDSRQAWIEER